MIAPVLHEIAPEYLERLKIVKLNIDESPLTPPKYGIRGIPTLMLFKKGRVEATKVGAVSKSQLTAFLDSNLWSTGATATQIIKRVLLLQLLLYLARIC